MAIVSGNLGMEEEADFADKDPTGRYIRYDDILGRGAFKTVYKAFDEVDGIEVAWNLVSIEDVMQMPGQLERLYSEVHLLKSLKHDNIIKLFHSWVDENTKTINMITELFTSGSLRLYRMKHRKVDPKAIKNWARQILKGLHYLHSQIPHVIHRDLKCDNIFVNGNTGEIKIGDLGLATVLQQPTARSVIGTPEFMAPELYEEEYTELVDIYSFGMCMLEMVTCEYPYSECRNQAQIFKKVTSGIKPQSLSRVDDPQVKQFIEKCLLPVSSRPTALQLSLDPFLSRDGGGRNDSALPLASASNPVRPPQVEHLPMDVDPRHNENKSVSVCSSGKSNTEESYPCCQTIELQRFAEDKEFRLRGERSDDVTASMLLRIGDSSGKGRIVHFAFYLNSDTATAIAEEMVEELHLTSQEVVVIADMIDDLIMQLHSERSSSHPNQTSLHLAVNEDHEAANQLTVNSKDEESMKSGISTDYYLPFSSDGSAAREAGQDQEAESMSSFLDSCSMMSTLYISDNEYPEDLKTELNMIESQFNQSVQDLLKLKEDAIENAKRKWIVKKQSKP